MNKRLALNSIALLYLVFLIAIQIFYPGLNGDEPAYGHYSRLIASGLHPLRDFWSQQMDLFFYIMGNWMKLFGFSFESGRLLGGILVFLTALSLSWHIKRLFRVQFWFALIAFCSLCFFFNTTITVTHYAVSNTFFVFSFILLCRALEESPQGKWNKFVLFLSGVSLGIAGGARILFEALFLLYIGFIVVLRQRRSMKESAIFLLGFTLSNSLVIAQIMAVGLNEFLFYKYLWFVQYGEVTQGGRPYSYNEFWNAVSNTFLHYQMVLLWIAEVFAMRFILMQFSKRRVLSFEQKVTVFSFVCIFFILVSYFQRGLYNIRYFSNGIVLLLYPFFYSYTLAGAKMKKVFVWAAVVLFLTGYIPGGLREKLPALVSSGAFSNYKVASVLELSPLGRILVKYVHKTKKNPSFKTIPAGRQYTQKTLEYLDSIGKNRNRVVVFDPFGYVSFLSGLAVPPGMEGGNCTGYDIHRKSGSAYDLDDAFIKKYHFIARKDIVHSLEHQLYDVIIYTSYMGDDDVKLMEAYYQPYFIDQETGYGVYVPRRMSSSS